MQVQVGSLYSKKSSLQYKGSFDCIRQCIATQGLRSLTAGATATVCREVPAYGIYFSVYEGVKDAIQERGYNSGVSSFAAGGLAGCCSWLSIYPVDVIKSTQQVCVYPLILIPILLILLCSY
jgi:solute carrier family 25 (mitochondrial carnitine/acylcarnitine transporter), member 20/29